MDARSTPVINSDFSSHKNSETSYSSEDLLTSSEHLFCAHETIDLSPDTKQTDKDYVRISKQEYEEIKSRVSAIESRLSREFTDAIPSRTVEPLQQVQNVYQQTLEDVAMLHCPTTDHLARRLSKELKIRPNEQTKIIRSPSARKIGTIRRRSKENVTKIVRHKSWNVSSQSQNSEISDRFYPYVGLTKRNRTNTDKKSDSRTSTSWDASVSDSSFAASDTSQKYNLRKRMSIATEYSPKKPVVKRDTRRSLNISHRNSWGGSPQDLSVSQDSDKYVNQGIYENVRQPEVKPRQKWRNAAAFFMDKTGEVDSNRQTGRPSVNKLRRQNAGGVLAKARLFETSSDKSSERNDRTVHTGFARRPRPGQAQNRPQKMVAYVKPKVQMATEPNVARSNRSVVPASKLARPTSKEESESCRRMKITTPAKKTLSPIPQGMKTPQTPACKKPLCTPRAMRTPLTNTDIRRTNTPMRAVHISPRRRSPRQKPQRFQLS